MKLTHAYRRYCLDNSLTPSSALIHLYDSCLIHDTPSLTFNSLVFKDDSLTEDSLLPALIVLSSYINSSHPSSTDHLFTEFGFSGLPLTSNILDVLFGILDLASKRGGISSFVLRSCSFCQSLFPTMIVLLSSCNVQHLTLESVGFSTTSFSALVKSLHRFPHLQTLSIGNLNHIGSEVPTSVAQRSFFSSVRKYFSLSNFSVSNFKPLPTPTITPPALINSLSSTLNVVPLVEALNQLSNLTVLSINWINLSEKAIISIATLFDRLDSLIAIELFPRLPFPDSCIAEVRNVLKSIKNRSIKLSLTFCEVSTNPSFKPRPTPTPPRVRGGTKLEEIKRQKLSFSAGAGLIKTSNSIKIKSPVKISTTDCQSIDQIVDSTNQSIVDVDPVIELTNSINLIVQEIKEFKEKESTLIDLSAKLVELSLSLMSEDSKSKLQIQVEKVTSGLEELSLNLKGKRDLLRSLVESYTQSTGQSFVFDFDPFESRKVVESRDDDVELIESEFDIEDSTIQSDSPFNQVQSRPLEFNQLINQMSDCSSDLSEGSLSDSTEDPPSPTPLPPVFPSVNLADKLEERRRKLEELRRKRMELDLSSIEDLIGNSQLLSVAQRLAARK
ncbi:hypothetical protein RCL1_000490 [Eukaryota sp. TZLM3-RCL]